jgi:GT2 family glycosyltransferase
VKRQAFDAVGGFDPSATSSADTEDIELGYRLSSRGYRIVLDPSLQVRHNKRYTLRGMIESDVLHRAIPWTRAMLDHRIVETGLNLRTSAIVSSGLAYVTLAASILGVFIGSWLFVAAGAAAAWTLVSLRFLRYAAHVCGPTRVVPMAALLLLYQLYSPIGFVAGIASYFARRHE